MIFRAFNQMELEMKQQEKELLGFLDFLKKIPDHRIERRKLYRACPICTDFEKITSYA